MANYTLQLLHHADFEGNTNAIEDAPELAALFDYFDDTYTENTLKLSGGDNWIPSPWYSSQTEALSLAVQAVYESLLGLEAGSLSGLVTSEGTIDQAILNVIGIQASTLGNHEFDQGPDDIARIIEFSADAGEDGVYSLSEITNLGSFFPYLTTNLDFSADPDLSDSYTPELSDVTAYGASVEALMSPEGIAALMPENGADLIAPYATVVVGGETIGLVGATTQRLESISSPGDVDVIGATDDDMDLLATQVQASVDQLTAQGVNKVILISHLQDYRNEVELAPKLSGVDIILSAGSDAIFADENDVLKTGHSANETSYPLVHTGADGKPILQVNTDGQYHYLGRLVVEFDENGVVIPESVDSSESGAYATTEQVIADLYGDTDPYAEGSMAGLVKQLADAVDSVIGEKLANVAGYSDVFLDGLRGTVRNQESNLGNLTADANRYFAEQYIDANPDSVSDSGVPLVSLKNGGGIRAEIGLPYGVSGPEAPVNGEVTQLGIETALAFNNGLVLYSTTAEGLKALLEHGIDNAGQTSGRFPQVSGVSFSFDETQPSGSKIQSLALTDDQGNVVQLLVVNGELVVPAEDPINIVTLNFLAETDGDGYPFAAHQVGELVYMYDDNASGFEAEGREQQAFHEYMQAFYATPETAFAEEETGLESDTRIQSLADRDDGVQSEHETLYRVAETLSDKILQVSIAAQFDSGAGEGGSEVVAKEGNLIYSTNSADDTVDQYDALTGEKLFSFDLTAVTNYGSITSVAVYGDLVAAAIENSDPQGNGFVAFFDANSKELLNTLDVGSVLPDMITFTADGGKLLVAVEAEPVDETYDPQGGVGIIDLSAGVGSAVATFVDFTAFDNQVDELREAGVRIFPDRLPSVDFEPEYIAINPAGDTAYVTLQEANAVAVLDIESATFTDILPLGTTDHSLPGFGLDASDRDDTINIANWPVYGMHMPDAIAAFDIDGTTYFATANEGDDRGEDERIKDLALDETAFPNADALQENDQLGRLGVSTVDGDIDGDGDYDQLFSYGSRSFTIFDSEGNTVFDSGEQFETIIQQIRPELFNQDDGDLEGRSDNKGPEPEAIAVGTIGDNTFAFIGLERDNGIMVYNISNPAESEFIGYIDAEAYGNISPEVIKFVPASESTTGKPQLAVAFEVSGTAALINLDQLGDSENRIAFGADTVAAYVESVYKAVLGREGDSAGLGYWIDGLESGALSQQALVEGFFYSDEFQSKGVMSTETFVESLYLNLLDRDSDAGGKMYWMDRLDNQGVSRSSVVTGFLVSDEHQGNLPELVLTGVEFTPYEAMLG